MQVGNAANIRIAGNPLPRGIYRLEAAVLLSLPNDVEPGSSGLSALLEAGLLQVY
jgi:hypothetical protein